MVEEELMEETFVWEFRPTGQVSCDDLLIFSVFSAD